MIKDEFAKNLLKARLANGMSQKEVATVIRRSREAYAHYENGVREPSFETLQTICDLFQVTPDELFGYKPFCNEKVVKHNEELLRIRLNSIIEDARLIKEQFKV